MRIVWLISGLVSLALGGLGVALPLLPTTPFVLLAAFCFARSSPALHGWLLRNPAFGKAIRDWRANRAISCRGKTASVLAMAVSLALSLALAVEPMVISLQALVLSGAAGYILTRKTAAQDPASCERMKAYPVTAPSLAGRASGENLAITPRR